MLFVEAPRTARRSLPHRQRASAARVPLMANMVEGGKTPILPAPELEALGFSLVIFPGGIVRALARTAQDIYGALTRARHDGRRSATACSTSRRINAHRSARDGHARRSGKTLTRNSDRSSARSGHARGAQRPARADRRRDGRDAVSLAPSTRSSPRRTTPATASITPRPAPRWCRARPACRSSSAPWRSP